MSYVSFHPLSRAGTRTSTHTHPRARLLLPPSLARKSTYRRPRERIIREEGGRNRWRDHVEIRVLCDATTAIPCAEFLACVRKCLGGILRYCHRIFSRNPLRSCLGPWTHTRVTFIPFFVSRPLNRTPLLPPLLPLLLTKFGWQGGIRRRSVAGSSFVSFERSNFYRRCAIRDGESKLSGYFFFSSPLPPLLLPTSSSSSYRAPPKFLSIYRKVGIELGNGDFRLIFIISVHDPRDGRDTFFAISYLQCPYIVWSEAQTPPVCLIFR